MRTTGVFDAAALKPLSGVPVQARQMVGTTGRLHVVVRCK
jgi:phosphoribosylcarboxyaminoimidazole (NCAIR) mutase